MRFVAPNELPSVWEFVKAGLLVIIKKTGEKWTPTHVLQALNEDRAHLFLCDDGFVVTQPCKDPWTSEPHVFVWAMWFKPGKARPRRKELVAWLDGISHGKNKFSSPLMGWHAMQPEYEIERIIWRRREQ